MQAAGVVADGVRAVGIRIAVASHLAFIHV